MEIILKVFSAALLCLGAFAGLVSAIGFYRFKNFYLRLHAATVGTIWGCVFPLIGAALLSVTMDELGETRWFAAGASIVTAVIVFLLAPVGSHALARAVHRARIAKVEPCLLDALDPTLCVGEDK